MGGRYRKQMVLSYQVAKVDDKAADLHDFHRVDKLDAKLEADVQVIGAQAPLSARPAWEQLVERMQ